MVNWEDIHPDLVSQLQQEWCERGFTPKKTLDWISIGLKPSEYLFAAYLEREGYTVENCSNYGGPEGLKKEYWEYCEKQNKIAEAIEKIHKAEKKSGKHEGSIEPRINGSSKQNKYLDTLARLLTGSKDTCVAVCYDETSKKLLVASNREKANYAEKYLEGLKKFVERLTNNEYENLLNLTFVQLKRSIEKSRAREITKIQFVPQENHDKFDDLKEKIKDYVDDNKPELSVIKNLAKEVFLETIQLRKERKISKVNEIWNYLTPLEDNNDIVDAIKQRKLGYEIIKAIKENRIDYVEGEENIHAEMKVINKLRQSLPTEKIFVYIGISKLSCLVCQSTIDTINKESSFSSKGYEFAIRGTHGGTYLNWIVPKLSSEEIEELLLKLERIESGNYPTKMRESTSIIPQEMTVDFEEEDKFLLEFFDKEMEVSEKMSKINALFSEKRWEKDKLDCLLEALKKGVECFGKGEKRQFSDSFEDELLQTKMAKVSEATEIDEGMIEKQTSQAQIVQSEHFSSKK